MILFTHSHEEPVVVRHFVVATLRQARRRVGHLLLVGHRDVTAVVLAETHEIVAYYDHGNWTRV